MKLTHSYVIKFGFVTLLSFLNIIALQNKNKYTHNIVYQLHICSLNKSKNSVNQ